MSQKKSTPFHIKMATKTKINGQVMLFCRKFIYSGCHVYYTVELGHWIGGKFGSNVVLEGFFIIS